jgi:hypothetical protein
MLAADFYIYPNIIFFSIEEFPLLGRAARLLTQIWFERLV